MLQTALCALRTSEIRNWRTAMRPAETINTLTILTAMHYIHFIYIRIGF